MNFVNLENLGDDYFKKIKLISTKYSDNKKVIASGITPGEDESLYFSEGLEAYLMLINKAFNVIKKLYRVIRSTRDNYEEEKEMAFLMLDQMGLKKEAIEAMENNLPTKEDLNYLYTAFLKKRVSYMLNIKGASKTAFDKLSDEEKAGVSYITSNNDDKTSISMLPNLGLKPNQMVAFITEGSILNGFDTLIYLVLKYKKLYPKNKMPLLYNPEIKREDDPLLEEFLNQLIRKARSLQ